jgi:hypothetical protein
MSKEMERLSLLAILGIAIGTLLLTGKFPASKTLSSAGVMLDMAGVVQLHIAGLFSTVVRDVFDKVTLPGMAPANGDTGALRARDAQNWLRRQIFARPRTGYIFLLSGFFLQAIAVWL